MDWRKYITVDPEVCHGKACIAGTRVPVAVILDNLAAGVGAKEITANYPKVTRAAIAAAIAYGAELAKERITGLPVAA